MLASVSYSMCVYYGEVTCFTLTCFIPPHTPLQLLYIKSLDKFSISMEANAVLLQLFLILSPAHTHALDDRELSYFKDQGQSYYVVSNTDIYF